MASFVWWQDPNNLSEFLRYLRDETCEIHTLDEGISVLDDIKKGKYNVEYAAMRALERADAARRTVDRRQGERRAA